MVVRERALLCVKVVSFEFFAGVHFFWDVCVHLIWCFWAVPMKFIKKRELTQPKLLQSTSRAVHKRSTNRNTHAAHGHRYRCIYGQSFVDWKQWPPFKRKINEKFQAKWPKISTTTTTTITTMTLEWLLTKRINDFYLRNNFLSTVKIIRLLQGKRRAAQSKAKRFQQWNWGSSVLCVCSFVRLTKVQYWISA